MQLQPIQTISQAISYIQSLPINRQQEMVELISIFQRQETQKKPCNNVGAFYQSWKKWHTENQEFLDNDDTWLDTKDRNDIGREVNFE